VPSFEAQPAAGLAPATARELDLGDLLADHARLDVDGAAVVDGIVASAHPELGRGLAAARARRAGWFDEWSGRVGADEALVVDADRPRSPTGLERYAECPFRSFLGSVLGVGAIDDPTDAELISALDEGSLVHEILEDFVREHAGKPPSEPWTDEERDRLDAIAAQVTGRYEAEGRTGRALLWGVRREQLRHQLHRVLDADERERARQQVAPVEVELAFDALAVVLANGRTVSFRGIIDRVDRSIDGRRLVVYDYKTGSPSGFAKVARAIRQDGDLTARGTKLQLPIYALAAKAAYPGAQEVSSYYWFVGRKGLGDTVGAVVDERAEARFRDVIDVVVEGIEEGRFPANPGDESWQFGQWTFEHCGWCEFDRVCPTSRGEQWVQLRGASELARYRELADPEPEAPHDEAVDEAAAS
jgi:ATP-dependent helicase/nuclease subunit B